MSQDSRIGPKEGKLTPKIRTSGNEESEIHESTEEEFVVFEAVEDVFGGDTALASGAPLVLFEPGFDVGAFVFFKPENSSVEYYAYLYVGEMED